MRNKKFKRASISHIKFIIIYTTLIYFVNNFLILDKFTKWFTTKGTLDLGGFLGFGALGLFLAIALISLFSHKYTTKIFAIFVIIASTFSTYFVSKYDTAIDSSMILNVINTNSSESLTLFSYSMIPYIIFLLVLPIIVILKIDINYDSAIKHISKSIATIIISLALGIGFIYLSFNAIHLAGNRSHKYILFQLAPVNFITSIANIGKKYIENNYVSKPDPVTIKASLKEKEDIIVVLAIGETSRQKNFSLYGYNKNTNPLLSKQNDIYILNGIAKYGSTIYAIPQILSRDDIKLPSIVQYVGIDSSCFVNFQLYGNCGTVKEIEVSNCGHNGKCHDEDVLPLLKEDLQTYKKGQKFVVLHLGAGSHGPLYNTRYPKEFQQFNPQCKSADVMNNCTKEELYNSFDNTILYVDYVVSNIIDTLEDSKLPYVFIYLSDHGESLLENDRVFHGMPPGITLPEEQAHIPLLIKASIPINIIKKDEYKQQDVYDTILDLLSIEVGLLKKDKVFIEKIK